MPSNRLTAVLAAVMLGAVAVAPVARADHAVSVGACWIRHMPGQIPSAGYFVLKNPGSAPVRLTGLSTDAYGHAMLHQTRTEGGLARMAMAHDIDVAPASELVFSPGGYHAMLEAPTRALKVGDQVRFTFTFGDGGSVSTSCVVRPASALGPDR